MGNPITDNTFDNLLHAAKQALHDKDSKKAYQFAKEAAEHDPDREEGWLILAALSKPQESIGFLKRALEINPGSKKAREGMRWAVKQLKETQQQNHPAARITEQDPKKKPARRKQVLERRWGLPLFFAILIPGMSLMIWSGIPVLSAQASAETDARQKNVLVKPTLTPTATMTPTPTPTLTPTPIITPTADTSYAAYFYHSWDIPEEVSGTNDFWIEVDLSGQMLYAYRGDQILNAFLVSTGTSTYPTVTGAYKVYSKHPTYTMIGPGYNLPDVPYALFFHKGYSIHGTYWHSNFGTPMSHGCVNMHTDDAAWVYDQAGVGTYVFVHY